VRAIPLGPPSAPAGLEVSTGDGKVLLTWTASKGATSYAVRRSAEGVAATVIGTTSEPTYTDASVANGTSYKYSVAAINSGGEGPGSAEVAATPVEPPTVPVGLAATAGNRRVSIGWFATPGAAGYSIRRATAPGGPYITIGKPTEPAFEDGSVENRTKYFYVVNAFNSAGRSPNSDPVEATPSDS
jgi:fibronectin type 3 domain-containing protein